VLSLDDVIDELGCDRALLASIGHFHQNRESPDSVQSSPDARHWSERPFVKHWIQAPQHRAARRRCVCRNRATGATDGDPSRHAEGATMRALDIMTPSVVTATPDMTIHDAARLFVDNRISGMPVVDANGQVVGIVSQGDLLHRVETGTCRGKRAWWLELLLSSPREQAARYVKEHGHVVGDVMCDQVISISEDMLLQQIADLMERRHLKRVPVLKDGKLVGIVSRSNLIRALASVALAVDSASHDDVSLRDAIVLEMHGQPWGLPKQGVLVKDGVAHLWGVIESEEEKRAIRIAAEGVPGVKHVESHLVFPSVMPSL